MKLASLEDINTVVEELRNNKTVRFAINEALKEAQNKDVDVVVIVLGLFALGVLYGRGLLSTQRKENPDAPRQ